MPAEESHILEILPDLRLGDLREIDAMTEMSVLEALELSLKTSRKAWAGYFDGEIVALFGVSEYSVLGSTGVPWLVGTESLVTNQKAFLRRCAGYVKEMKQGFYVLENYIDCRNDVAINWLRWLGFKMHDPEIFGPRGLPFHRFTMECKSCA